MRIIAAHIQGARGLLRMTQEQLAEAANVSLPALIGFETGTRVPQQRTIDALRDALERRGVEFSNGDSPGVKLVPSKAVIPPL